MEELREILDKVIKGINEEKERLIKERIFEILGYELDVITESTRRFPRCLTTLALLLVRLGTACWKL